MTDRTSIIVTSNSKVFTHNRTHTFRVRLGNPLRFSGQWQCALESIVYPHSWMMLGIEESPYIRIRMKDKTLPWIKIPLNNGEFQTLEELVGLVNTGIRFRLDYLTVHVLPNIDLTTARPQRFRKRRSASPYSTTDEESDSAEPRPKRGAPDASQTSSKQPDAPIQVPVSHELGPAARQAEEEKKRKAEEEKRKAEEEKKRKAEEEKKRKAEEEKRKKAEEEKRRKAEEEKKRKTEEEKRKKAEEEKKKKEDEERRKKAQEEANKRQEERRAAEEARKKAEEARRRAEQEAAARAAATAGQPAQPRVPITVDVPIIDVQRQAAEEARRKADEARRRKADEDARKKAAEDAQRRAGQPPRTPIIVDVPATDLKKKAEEEARRKAEEERKRAEAARTKAAEEARRKAQEDEARRKKEEEEKQRREQESLRSSRPPDQPTLINVTHVFVGGQGILGDRPPSAMSGSPQEESLRYLHTGPPVTYYHHDVKREIHYPKVDTVPPRQFVDMADPDAEIVLDGPTLDAIWGHTYLPTYIGGNISVAMIQKIGQYLQGENALNLSVSPISGGRVAVNFNSNVIEYIEFNNELRHILGFDSNKKKFFNQEYAPFRADLKADLHNFVVYETNGLIQRTMFSESLAPVLRVVTIRGEIGKPIEENYPNPMRVPVQAVEIDELNFEIRTLSNKPILFQYGTVVMTLAFRRMLGY